MPNRSDTNRERRRTPRPPRRGGRGGRRGAGRWLGLQDKLLISMTLLVCVTLLAAGLAFTWYGGQQVRLLKRQEGGHVAAAAAVAAAHVLDVPQDGPRADQLDALARRLLLAPDITAVSFYDDHGRPLSAWRNGEDGEAIRFVTDVLSAGEVALEDERNPAAVASPALDVLLPIITDVNDAGDLRPRGFVGVRVNNASAMAYVHQASRVIAGGGLAVLAVILPLVFLMVHRAFAPIRRLDVAARQVAAGRFETVDVVRGDALGNLAEAFNYMVIRLAEQRGRVDEAQARLLEANLNLERKVDRRTYEIESASRQLANEIAEKEDFLRAVSHDLNAPLRNIDGLVAMLLRKHEKDLPPEVLGRLDRIKKNVKHETDLINELLELSRIKTRRDEMEPVNLEELIWDLRGLFEADLRQRGIDLVIESRLPTLLAERGRIRQIFQNLIDNAVKYMGDGGVARIAIGARVGRSETEFWVSDTGIGVPPEDVDKVFFVFRRGSNQGAIAGKGVGLASVKSIVENYHGKIWVESGRATGGRGSTFRFTINGRFVRADGNLFAGEPTRFAGDRADLGEAGAVGEAPPSSDSLKRAGDPDDLQLDHDLAA